MISVEPHNVPLRWDGVSMFTLKIKKLRPRDLKFLAIHHRMSRKRGPQILVLVS